MIFTSIYFVFTTLPEFKLSAISADALRCQACFPMLCGGMKLKPLFFFGFVFSQLLFFSDLIKVDPELQRIIDSTTAFVPRFFAADPVYQVLITFNEESVVLGEGPVQPKASLELHRILSERNQKCIEVLIPELDRLGGWAPIQRYSVSNSWLVSGTSRVIEFLTTKIDLIAELHWDRPFDVPLDHIDIGQIRNEEDEDDNFAEWNIRYIGAHRVWPYSTGKNLIYASADTGVDYKHPILARSYASHLWFPDAGGMKHDYSWWDGVGTLKSPEATYNEPVDEDGHGTHTTSIAVGSGGYGVAPGAFWIACRNMFGGVGSTSTYLNCLEFFLAPTDLNGKNPDPSKRPHVIGNSYGCPKHTEGCATWAFHKAILALREAGIAFVVSAGNTGPNCSSISSPPAYEPQALTVGATRYHSDVIAPFSSRGPILVQRSFGQQQQALRIKPELVAPGMFIRGAFKKSQYATLSGTSMAAPHVAGAILLISQACPFLLRKISKIENLLLNTSKRLYVTSSSLLCGTETTTSYPNCIYGYGMPQLEEAIKACLLQEKFAFTTEEALFLRY